MMAMSLAVGLLSSRPPQATAIGQRTSPTPRPPGRSQAGSKCGNGGVGSAFDRVAVPENHRVEFEGGHLLN